MDKRTLKGILGLSWLLVSAAPVFAQSPQVVAVVNAATFQSGMPNGGALATVFVSGLQVSPNGPYPGLFVANSMPLPSTLGDVQILVCLAVAPLLAVYIPPQGSSNYVQINFQVPLERNVAPILAPDCSLSIYFSGQYNTIAGVSPLPQPALGGFFSDGNGNVIANHASDNSPVTSSNPAHPGETINAYANDIFETWPEPPVGIPAPAQPQITNALGSPNLALYLQAYPSCMSNPIPGAGPIQCPANTPPLATTFLGMAPGQIGVEQVNFTVPANQQPGNWPLFFNNSTSQTPSILLPVQ
jgi:uncharacterized protein (TIGR03437 family)